MRGDAFFKWSDKHKEFIKVCGSCLREFKGGSDREQVWQTLRRNFSENWRSPDGLRWQCRDCNCAQVNGRPSVDVDAMLAEQGNKCAICSNAIERGRRGYVDHDHATGAIRAMLCPSCNSRMSGVDDDEWLKKAIAYRDQHRGFNRTIAAVMVCCADPHCGNRFKRKAGRLYCSAECAKAVTAARNHARRKSPPPQVEWPIGVKAQLSFDRLE